MLFIGSAPSTHPVATQPLKVLKLPQATYKCFFSGIGANRLALGGAFGYQSNTGKRNPVWSVGPNGVC